MTLGRTLENISTTSSLGQFLPTTAAEKELERMLNGPDEKIDLALANYLIAADIPTFKDITREEYLKYINEYCDRVAYLITRAKENSDIAGPLSDPNNLMFAFCSGIISNKFSYAEEFRDPNLNNVRTRKLYQDPNNVFLVGLLKTKNGSCVSMPLIYVVIAQKLGYPVYLVTIGQHYFVRWQQPGFKMNIETTIVEKVSFTPNEDPYFQVEKLRPEDIKGTYCLRNMTNREVVGNLFQTRAAYYDTIGEPLMNVIRDVDRSNHLAPNDPQIKMFMENIKERVSRAYRVAGPQVSEMNQQYINQYQRRIGAIKADPEYFGRYQKPNYEKYDREQFIRRRTGAK